MRECRLHPGACHINSSVAAFAAVFVCENYQSTHKVSQFAYQTRSYSMNCLRSNVVRTVVCGWVLAGLSVTGRADEPKKDDKKIDFSAKFDLSEVQRFYESILPELSAGHRPEAADEVMRLLFTTNDQPIPGFWGPGHSRYDWPWVSTHFDPNRDGKVVRTEYCGTDSSWSVLDRDANGTLTSEDFDWENSDWARQEAQAQTRFRAVDADNDGQLTSKEWAAAFSKAAGDKASLSFEEFRKTLQPAVSRRNLVTGPQSWGPKRRFDYLRAILTQDVGTFSEGPQVNEPAPDFALKTHDGKGPIRLSSFRGTKPVILTFGSITCPPYRQRFPGVEALRQRYGNSVEFLAVYIREAHAADGWVLEGNTRAKIEVPQHTNQGERLAASQRFCEMLKPSYPLLVDEFDDHVTQAYSATPNRLYLIDRDGKVAYKSGRGPRGYRMGELEQSLVLHLLDQESPATHVAAGQAANAAK
jgi:peroxiredoxin